MSKRTSRQRALANLAVNQGQKAWATAYSLCRNSADAEDLVQKAFVVAASRDEGLPDGNEWPWLAKVIINLYRNEWRKSVRRGEIVNDDSLIGAPDKRAKDPATEAELSDVGQRLRAQMELLPLAEREAVVLTHVSGLSQQAAAESLGVPRTTLVSNLKNGIDRLRKKMGKDDHEVVALLSSAGIVPPHGGYAQAIERWSYANKNPLAAEFFTSPKILAMAGGVACAAVAALIAFTFWFNEPETPLIAASEMDPGSARKTGENGTGSADATPSEEADVPRSSLVAFEFSEKEVQRFLDARPTRLSEPPPDYGLPPQFGTKEAFEASRKEAESNRKRRRTRAMQAGPWKYPTQREAERTAHVQGLIELQNREGWVHPDGVFRTRTENQSDSEKPPGDVVPASDGVFTTAMTLLALTRAGRDHKKGDSRAASRMAILWARKTQDMQGNFAHSVTDDQVIHHAAATLSVSEIYRVTGDAVLKPIVDKALDKLQEFRNADGGWGSAPHTESNVLATGFALLALASSSSWASLSPTTIDDALQGIAHWLWKLRDTESTHWSVSSAESPEGLPSARLADAVFVLGMHWGKYWTLGDYSVERALQRLRNQPTDWPSSDPMTRFFSSIALWTVDPDRSLQWSLDTVKTIDSAGQKHVAYEGEEDFWLSWSGQDAYTKRFGKAFCTAASVFVLYQCRSYIPSLEILDPSGVLEAEHVKVLDPNGVPIGRAVQMHLEPDESGTATAVLVTDLPAGTVKMIVTIAGAEVVSKTIETKIDKDLKVTLNH